jgi:hypothetical protein
MKVLGANNILGQFRLMRRGTRSSHVLGWNDLLKTPPERLEHWLARNPPFGSNLIREALAKDRYDVQVE